MIAVINVVNGYLSSVRPPKHVFESSVVRMLFGVLSEDKFCGVLKVDDR